MRLTRKTIILLLTLTLIPSTSCSILLNKSEDSSPSFLTQCTDLASLGIGLQCRGAVCKGEEGNNLNLDQVQRVKCVTESDCMTEHTMMKCNDGLCECPPYQALNISSCSCQTTALCVDSDSDCTQHNGRQCQDSYCSCYGSVDYSTLLVDTATLFCLLPGDQGSQSGGGVVGAGVAGLGVLAGVVLLIVLALAGIAACKACKWGKVREKNLNRF